MVLDPSLGFSLQRGRQGVSPADRAASVARATAFIVADTVAQQLRDRGYKAVPSDAAGPEAGGRALIISGVFRSINEGHRRHFAAKDASVVVSVEIDTQTHGEKPQRLKSFRLDSQQIPHESGKHREPGVNSAAMRLATMIAHAVAELAHREDAQAAHGCKSTARPAGRGALFVTPPGKQPDACRSRCRTSRRAQCSRRLFFLAAVMPRCPFPGALVVC